MRPKPLLKDAISLLILGRGQAEVLGPCLEQPKHHFQVVNDSSKRDEKLSRSIDEKSWTDPQDFRWIPRATQETLLCAQNPC